MEITYKKSHYLCLFNDLLIFVDSWLRSGPLEQQHKLLCIGKYSRPIVSSVFVFVKKRECTCTNTTTCEEGKQNLRPECSITYLLILASYTYIFFPYSLLKSISWEREVTISSVLLMVQSVNYFDNILAQFPRLPEQNPELHSHGEMFSVGKFFTFYINHLWILNRLKADLLFHSINYSVETVLLVFSVICQAFADPL